jgi:hypothetical protein
LVKNQARFADGGPVVIDSINGQNVGNAQLTVRYLRTIPANDNTLIDNSYVATTPEQAAFAEVTITPLDYSVLFPVQFLIGPPTLQISAQAVAGNEPAVCQLTPMFMCNPYEWDPADGDPPGDLETIQDAVSTTATRRRMIELRQKGPSASYAPGNFGYLKPPSGNPGAQNFANTIAQVRPNTCFGARGVYLRTGEAVGPVRFAVNVRFDAYQGFYNNPAYKNNANYRPARSVRKGYPPPTGGGAACSESPASNYGQEPTGTAQYMALPRDNCLYAGDPNNPCTELNGTPMEGKIGDGLWNFQAYWDTNFHTGGVYPNSWSNDPAHLPSRHEVYRYEVDNGLIPTRSLGNPSGTPPHLGEDGTPECYGGGAGTISDDPDRRLL